MKFFSLMFILLILMSCNPEIKHNNIEKGVKEIENFLEELNHQNSFSGVILIAKNDSILFEKAYGFANLDFNIPNTLDTKFNIASMGKMFTGISIMQLVEKGKLTTSDNVGKYLPEYPNRIVRDSVSIHQLLTHTSGLPDFMTPEYYASNKDKFRTLHDFSYLYQTKELNYKPGTKFVYCNSDYMLLGLIIERITGQTYDEYIEENIFNIAKMTNTKNYMKDHIVEDLAVGYSRSTFYFGELMKNTYLGGVTGGPAGGGYSTLKDLFNFSKALKNNKFLNTNNTHVLTKGKADENTYAYGFVDVKTNNHKIIGHSGGHFGVACELRIFEDLNYTVILLTNRDAEDGFLDARYFIQKQLAGSTPSIESYYNTKKVIKSIIEDDHLSSSPTALSKLKLREDMLNVEGYHQLNLKNYDIAIKLFKLVTELFPNSANAFDSLGEAYMKSGDKYNSIINYEKSLKLDSSNNNAMEMIKILKST